MARRVVLPTEQGKREELWGEDILEQVWKTYPYKCPGAPGKEG